MPFPGHPEISACQEPSIVKLPDGRLFCVMRTASGSPFWSVSADGGETWTRPRRLLRKDGGEPLLHPLSPCPIYDVGGNTAGSGRYVLFIHNHDGHYKNYRPHRHELPSAARLSRLGTLSSRRRPARLVRRAEVLHGPRRRQPRQAGHARPHGPGALRQFHRPQRQGRALVSGPEVLPARPDHRPRMVCPQLIAPNPPSPPRKDRFEKSRCTTGRSAAGAPNRQITHV